MVQFNFLSSLCLLGAKCKVSHAQAALRELQPKFWPHTSSEAIPHEQKPWSKPEQGSLQLSLSVFLTGAYEQQEQESNAYGSLPSSATEDITRRNLEQGTQPCLPVSSEPCPASSQRAGAAWLSSEKAQVTHYGACTHPAALSGLRSSNLIEILPLEQPPSSPLSPTACIPKPPALTSEGRWVDATGSTSCRLKSTWPSLTPLPIPVALTSGQETYGSYVENKNKASVSVRSSEYPRNKKTWAGRKGDWLTGPFSAGKPQSQAPRRAFLRGARTCARGTGGGRCFGAI